MVARDRERFNCQACRFHRHCDDSNPAGYPMFAIPEIGLESRTCLLPMVTDFSRQLLKSYWHYKNGLLPLAGGMLDQPAIFGEAMEVIDAQVNRLNREEREG